LLQSPSQRYWFWSGQGSLETARKEWSEKLARVFEDGKIKGHAYQFRDTFAVELLKAEVPIERVSVLLGQASVRITEKQSVEPGATGASGGRRIASLAARSDGASGAKIPGAWARIEHAAVTRLARI